MIHLCIIMKATIEVELEKVVLKTVGPSHGGKTGVVYLPKELIGKNVTVVIE